MPDLLAIDEWLEKREHVVSLASYLVGFCGLLLAVSTLIYNVRHNARTRNFSSVLALHKLVRDEKANFEAVAAVRPRIQDDYKWAAAHYFNTLELVTFSLNNAFVSGNSTRYLASWMKSEISYIYQSKTQGTVMRELLEAAKARKEPHPFEEIFRFHPPQQDLPASSAGQKCSQLSGLECMWGVCP